MTLLVIVTHLIFYCKEMNFYMKNVCIPFCDKKGTKKKILTKM